MFLLYSDDVQWMSAFRYPLPLRGQGELDPQDKAYAQRQETCSISLHRGAFVCRFVFCVYVCLLLSIGVRLSVGLYFVCMFACY